MIKKSFRAYITGNGELSSDEFLSLLGYPDPTETMWDYLRNLLTLDQEFLWFAERNYRQYDFVLLSNQKTVIYYVNFAH